VNITGALREATASLEVVSDTARLDAELLLAEAQGVSRSELLLRHMDDPVPPKFEALIARRLQHEPVAYILGRQEFFGREFLVTPDVLIPRADSETTVQAALDACPSPSRVLDCGTGSGALLLTVLAERTEAEGLGIDRSLDALVVALKNADRLGINAPPTSEELEAAFGRAGVDLAQGSVGYLGRARFRAVDWRQKSWRDHMGKFDLIIANPPYVETDAELAPDVRQFEPSGALFSGKDGLDDYLLLIPQLPAMLNDGGFAVLEIGHKQAESVSRIAREANFSVQLRHDLAGRPRALVLQLGLGIDVGNG
jgi:release factor glutamine methyltransferase